MKKIILALTLLFTLSIASTSCRDEKSAGEKIEDGVEEVGEGLEDAADDIEDEID
ncbi:hypothetical protein L3X39_08770 [Sabulilitoribacter multivorans]|uniref:Uncharacterized protein n=1 Tax=Flaviramulus multivorans TaxID=1304750 RepID=A0ABS9IJE8_9FLAO|nr:hypothetical protein [Flaviramulus multivorans]MCF7560729.1 hypothetical protein [Flaviramulus multivorans]